MSHFYCHPESECIWASNNPNEAEGLVEKIDKSTFDRLDAAGYSSGHKPQLASLKYAGIGSRATPPHVLGVMKHTATLLGYDGYTCCTGAAPGADQAFANGAFESGNAVSLHIPWPAYENDWITSIYNQIGTVKVTVLRSSHKEAWDSVDRFHPFADKLKQSVKKLHARNYSIVNGASFVICWTTEGKITGGTGQGLRIAASMGIPVFNLGIPEVLSAFITKIDERKKELV